MISQQSATKHQHKNKLKFAKTIFLYNLDDNFYSQLFNTNFIITYL
jgi:hypothetical protein